MRILHILDHSLPLHSGYAFRTAAILREQRARGWETVQLTTPRQGPTSVSQETADGWEFHRTPSSSGSSPVPGLQYLREMRSTRARILELVDRHAPDVLHAHSPVLNALPALWAARKRAIPVVYEVRAMWEDAAVDHGTTTEGSLRYRISRRLETHAMRRADHITTICEGLRSEIADRGIPLDRITVIPNAVDTGAFRFNASPDEALKSRLGLDGATVIGFAGSFYGYEGLDLLLEAFASLRRTRADLKLLLVGGGPQEAALETQAQGLGLAGAVIFTGRVPHAEVQRYYDLIDVLAYPRHRMRLTELVTPLKPLEAMAQGRMLIASDVGGHRELIRDGETGFLFPAGNAAALASTLEAVLNRRADWPRLRTQARQFVEQERTWTRSVARYAEVYRKVTTASGSHTAVPAKRPGLE
jgi:PEP-CTERM/exosortase A-associated glycosyltransferase